MSLSYVPSRSDTLRCHCGQRFPFCRWRPASRTSEKCGVDVSLSFCTRTNLWGQGKGRPACSLWSPSSWSGALRLRVRASGTLRGVLPAPAPRGHTHDVTAVAAVRSGEVLSFHFPPSKVGPSPWTQVKVTLRQSVGLKLRFQLRSPTWRSASPESALPCWAYF